MTKHETITAPDTATGHKSIAAALAAAQMEMGKALKQANNPHFRSKYADLGNVMDACLPALNKNGIAVVQPTTDDDTGRYVKTILIHGETGETLECRVPLIVSKNDMQGYGSAVTYARRYGLMAMAGIAPEEDDGNAAAKAAPPAHPLSSGGGAQQQVSASEIASDQMITAIRKSGADVVQASPKFQQDFPRLKKEAPEFAARVEAEIETWKQANKPAPSSLIDGDEIPY
ncbi:MULTISPECIES: ERF family protein [unclassified Phaeobacter]|uniref:ERF family protein n=1 Tax=unclassified Phaeobacter TaxID=2621772 RepID=UPI003A86A744